MVSLNKIHQADAVIIGGGIAGLWLLRLLSDRGYRTALFEANRLGCQQTLASQGMIHGGLKYTLTGTLTGASEAIAAMPGRWRRNLSGEDVIDLSSLEPISEHYYMFADGGSMGKLAGFFASRMLRGRIQKLDPPAFPEVLGGFGGVVYQLNDFVLNSSSLLRCLLQSVAGHAYQKQIEPADLQMTERGWRINLGSEMIDTRQLILAAGAGTGDLLSGLSHQVPDWQAPEMQLRPLHQVIVRHPDLQPFYAHCLTGISRSEPRLTITSHPDEPSGGNRWLWYLGGQLATDGAARERPAQIEFARKELTECVPWIDWSQAIFDCMRIDRAEPKQTGGRRPDQAFVENRDGCLICWPTKLSLAPDLGDRLLAEIAPPEPGLADFSVDLPLAEVGLPPWCR